MQEEGTRNKRKAPLSGRSSLLSPLTRGAKALELASLAAGVRENDDAPSNTADSLSAECGHEERKTDEEEDHEEGEEEEAEEVDESVDEESNESEGDSPSLTTPSMSYSAPLVRWRVKYHARMRRRALKRTINYFMFSMLLCANTKPFIYFSTG